MQDEILSSTSFSRSPHLLSLFFVTRPRVQLTSVLNVTEYVLGVDSRAMGQT